MKLFIHKIIKFTLFAAVFYTVAVFFWGRYMPAPLKPNIKYKIGSYGHMFTRLKQASTVSNVDVLFLGSSHAYRGFDNRIFSAKGISSFNLGSGAQTPVQTKVLLQRYLTTIKPKFIVYEVYPGTFTSDGVESALDLIANQSNDFNSLCMAVKVHHPKVYNTLLYGYLNDVLGNNKNTIEPAQKKLDTYVSGGYVERQITHYKPKKLPNDTIQINPKQLTAFEQCLALLKAKNIPVLLVYAPIAPSNYKRYSKTTTFDSTMAAHAPYINYNGVLALNDSLHFYDSHHLNQIGVNLFNQHLLQRLDTMVLFRGIKKK